MQIGEMEVAEVLKHHTSQKLNIIIAGVDMLTLLDQLFWDPGQSTILYNTKFWHDKILAI